MKEIEEDLDEGDELRFDVGEILGDIGEFVRGVYSGSKENNFIEFYKHFKQQYMKINTYGRDLKCVKCDNIIKDSSKFIGMEIEKIINEEAVNFIVVLDERCLDTTLMFSNNNTVN